MKKMLLITSVLLISTGVFANSASTLSDTSEAVGTALTQFESESTAADVSLFKGIKASPSGHGVSVKVYLTNGTKISYSCHRHEDSDPFECHQSN
jgi:hypothetical protein